MKTATLFLFVLMELITPAQTIVFSVSCTTLPYQFSLTCTNSQINLLASSNFSAPVNYAWTGTNFSGTGSTVTISNPGNYIVTASSGTLSTTQTISIVTNTVFPICIASSTFQVNNATITAVPFTWTVTNLTNNLSHYTYYPPISGLPPYVNGGITSVFSAGPLGTYTHCVTNIENGCATCIPFILSFAGPVIPTTTTSIGENSSDSHRDEKLSVFPNPSNGIFKIDSKNIAINSIEVYSNLGALVRVEFLNADRQYVNIQNEPPGIYSVKILEDNGSHSFLKMIRE